MALNMMHGVWRCYQIKLGGKWFFFFFFCKRIIFCGYWSIHDSFQHKIKKIASILQLSLLVFCYLYFNFSFISLLMFFYNFLDGDVQLNLILLGVKACKGKQMSDVMWKHHLSGFPYSCILKSLHYRSVQMS